MRDEKRDAKSGNDDEAENGCGEKVSGRAVVALRHDNCGILIGWRVVMEEDNSILHMQLVEGIMIDVLVDWWGFALAIKFDNVDTILTVDECNLYAKKLKLAR